jgi:hypothetical protein
VVAGRYPEGADSLLLRNEGGRLTVWQRFEKLGLVSGAVWSDLDGDGQVELVLACEWGPVRIFRQQRGTFSAWDWPVSWGEGSTLSPQPSTISQLSGWWNGVTAGELDGDGRLDLIVSNWGLNSSSRTSPAQPLRAYYGDLDGNGTVEVIEGRYEPSLQREVPVRGWRAVGAALPFLREKISSYEAYGRASLREIYGEKLASWPQAQVTTLSSVVLWNRGSRFEAQPLPREAQLAPTLGVCVGDLDGDGKEDVFLSQNFFAVRPEDSRCDAGRGLWLRGDGKGGLEAVAGQISGVKVYGEQRGCALADYDADGRVDLVVTQNGAVTKLFHNVGAKPGLRVRLKGGANNPWAVGAQMRVVSGTRAGPVREVHAGSGYWSQDGAVQVLGLEAGATELWVRWPGGKEQRVKLNAGVKEVEVGMEGLVKEVKR